MALLKNAKHERFAQLIALGEPKGAAYEKVFGKKVPQNATALLKTPDVVARVQQIREEAAKKTAISLEEINAFLADIIRTPIGKVNETSPLCQSFKVTMTGTEYKMPDKLRALELAAKLAGYLKDTPTGPSGEHQKPIMVIIPNVIAEPRPLKQSKVIDV